MLATFKETYASLSHLEYGQTILTKKTSSVFWYWLKYPLIFAILILFGVLASVSYFTPQLSKLASEKLPQFDLTVQKGVASTKMTQPQIFKQDDLALILDLKGKPSDLDAYKQGALLLSDRVIFKTEDSSGTIKTNEMRWSEFGDFTFDKNTVVNWLSTNKMQLVLGLCLVSLLLGVFIFGFYVLGQFLGMFLWTLVFFVLAKIFKKTADFGGVMNLVMYASVITVILGFVNIFLNNAYLSLAGTIIFIFYAGVWVYKLK